MTEPARSRRPATSLILRVLDFVDRAGNDFSGAKIAVLFRPLLFVLVAFTWGLLKIPSLVNSLFTGKSGESALPF